METYITCPICGKKVKRLKKHFYQSKIHKGFDYKTYLMKHPEIPIVSEEESYKLSQTQKTYCRTEKGQKQMSRMANILWEDPEKRSKRVEEIRLQHTTEEFKILHREVGRKFMSEKMSTPEGFRLMTKGIKTYGKRVYYTRKDGRVLPLRSHLEECITIKLDSFENLVWEYEAIKIPWTDEEGMSHSYFPDFYLPELGIIIEGKPKSLWEREDSVVRKKAAEKSFKFYFVDYDTSVIDKIIESVTTIESIDSKKDTVE